MEDLKKRLITSYVEYLKEMNSSLIESTETSETDEVVEPIEQLDETDQVTEVIESNEVVETNERVNSEPVGENKVILSFDDFVKNK